jgi:pimeloyl-ACP methyl ester carboxylesterase
MPTAPVASGDIQYELHGEGTPLLLVAGLGGVAAYWQPQLEAYARYYRAVTYDHRGCGRSTRSKGLYTVDEMTGDLLSLMDHLEIEKAHLLGHSTGGAIGQTLAVTHPERLLSLALYSSWTRTYAFMRRSDDFLTPFYFSEELARRIPGARLTALARGGDAASQIEQEAFDRAVLDFLASVEKA